MAAQENETSGPEPIMKGSFALYETPKGGYHLAYQPEEQEIKHVEIPGHFVSIMKARMGGKKFNMASLFGGK